MSKILSLNKYLLISKKKTGALALVQQIDFCGFRVEMSGGVVPPNYIQVFVC